jgi:hypothetical protein
MHDHDRRAELIAAAVADALDAAERRELDALRADDPSIDAEIAELRDAAAGLPALGAWHDATPPAAARERMLDALAREAAAEDAESGEAAEDAQSGEDAEPASPAPAPAPVPLASRRPAARVATAILGAAACLAIGAGVALGAQQLAAAPPTGPAGTLGAVEHIDFRGEPDGVTVRGDLVAHTWGTETLLEIDGLPADADYRVVVLGDDGREFDSGGFVGAAGTIVCAMNAAVLREDVASVEIRTGDGATVAAAGVSPVG